MKKLLLMLTASIIFFGLVTVKAQTTETTFKRCGTADADQYNKAHDSIYKMQREQMDAYVAQWVHDHPDYDSKTTVTIPVVVHIIYKTGAQNIADSRVTDQIAATNTDWAGANSHSMHAFSSSLKANTNVQFCLAKRDPSGNATTGITRTVTTVTSFNITGYPTNSCTGYPERCTAGGGCAAWDVTKYFNIWVCNTGTSGLCGISEFPGSTLNNYYGSTINYIYFGVSGATAPYNLGGTLTHEIGHCFNLYHTWGDDGGPCSGSDYCTDTPNSGNMNYGNIEDGSLAEQSSATSTINTSTGLETDNCTAASPGVLYEDFMDYTDDKDYACFTPNQVSRIAASIATSGPCHNLTLSNGCTPLGIEEGAYIQDVNIFPNPTNGELNVNFNLANPTNVVVSVYNVIGKEIVSYNKENASVVNTKIDLSKCASGVYFVKITSTNQTLTQKISLIR
jgi:hypothetical protein